MRRHYVPAALSALLLYTAAPVEAAVIELSVSGTSAANATWHLQDDFWGDLPTLGSPWLFSDTYLIMENGLLLVTDLATQTDAYKVIVNATEYLLNTKLSWDTDPTCAPNDDPACHYQPFTQAGAAAAYNSGNFEKIAIPVSTSDTVVVYSIGVPPIDTDLSPAPDTTLAVTLIATPAPEPATLGVLGSALIGLGLTRFRKRRQAV